VKGLKPRVAVLPLGRSMTGWPEWVNKDGTFNNDLDFDEFIALCRTTGAEPVIMVNLLSYREEGGPTLEYLKQSAVEWVRYSNIVRKYNVTYWELGNEVEGKFHDNIGEYLQVYTDFRDAMQAVDPNIQLGFGAHARSYWFDAAMQRYADRIDFLIAHPYVNELKNYEEYLAHDGTNLLIDRAEDAINAIRRYAPPEHRDRMKVLVTECSSFSWRGHWENRDNNMLKAMVWFEMMGNMLNQPEVLYWHFWGAHSPYTGRMARTDDKALDWANNVLPMGFASKVVADYLRDTMVQADRVSGPVRTYASYSPDRKALSIYLLNKSRAPEPVTVAVDHYTGQTAGDTWIFTGVNGTPDDLDYTWDQGDGVMLDGGRLDLLLPPCSVTVAVF
jgi:hypothetical protein